MINICAHTILGLLSLECIKGTLELFRRRDKQVEAAFNAIHEGQENVFKFKTSKFFNEEFISELLSGDIDLFKYFQLEEGFTIQQYHRIYCLHRTDNSLSIAFFDFTVKTLYFISPSMNHEELPGDIKAMLESIIVKFEEALADPLTYNFSDWSVELYPHTFIEPVQIQNGDCNGICTLAVLYFLVMNVPIYITLPTLDLLRTKFCYWLVGESLPL